VISNNNLIENNGSAIVLTGYSSTISNNNIEYDNRGIGTNSAYSVIFGNNITNSVNWGIYFEGSNNVVVANYIANNRWGIYLSPAFPPENNTFYHNDFVNNVKQVNIGSPNSVQIWDDGYPSGGNYWSNYAGVDLTSGTSQNQLGSDGIGATPMVIGPNNTDNYPLIAPFDISTATLPCACQPSPIQNNTVALWAFDTLAPDGSTPDSTGNNPITFANHHVGLLLPNLVPGKFGQALNVSFDSYGVASASSSLDVSGAITISVWVKVASFENTTYNNILVQSAGTLNQYLSRVYGLALNGLSPSNATSGPLGAVCGYVTTTSGFNEIVTLTPAVQLNQWTNIVFTRSLTTGMHIYVNGVEQPVMVTSGSQDPPGNIVTGNELYLGHDFSGEMSKLRISNIAEAPQLSVTFQTLWLQWWFWLSAVGAVVAILAGVLYFRSKSRKK
jgi:hypothetical protein